MARVNPVVAILASAALALAGCGGGGGSTPAPVTTPPATGVFTQPAALALSATDVQQVIAQSVAEAQARGTPAVISVTDRVGNVLAVYRMTGAPSMVTIRPGAGPQQLDLQSVQVPASLAAIAKAITGAYLSSGGNAFSTRTASEIVQETFPPEPATVGLGSGPLFGVQFSQLPCSDLEFPTLGKTIGPHPSPLGLAGDPGGFPLYKNGVLVGGVGVKATTDYGF
ncbi:MAG TPA: heme-binding protein, partial [Caulobacteraceae bacterium]|nr:heme-binding protein [Caulobacteraceae bacterium]